MFIVLILDIRIANMNMGTSDMWKVLYILSIAVFLNIWILGAYLFPLVAKFKNTAKNTVKNAAILAIRHLPVTIIIVLLNSLLPIIFIASIDLFLRALLIYSLIGFAFIAYMNSMLFLRIFDKYIEKE